uniref:Secreted putative heparin-binding protein n=1 Tax=Pristhesancus plagipennis TaxID=1955184 RepID=A0A2K8JSB9_PRIPG|nr:secreted putative heparin-binding protein [Pristhesancus plagipennis]
MKWSCCILVAVVLLASVVLAEGEIWEEDEKEVLIRSERGAKKDPCRYEKGPWSECDASTNTRSRQLTLKKKSDEASSTCEPTKTIQKKCKKACRYEKGTWSQCNEQNEMVRTDTLKEKSDPSCEQSRSTTKKCKNKAGRPNKANKGSRRNRQP